MAPAPPHRHSYKPASHPFNVLPGAVCSENVYTYCFPLTLASEIAKINLMEKSHKERSILYNASYQADMNDSQSGSDK